MAMLFPDPVAAPAPADAELPAYVAPGGVIYPKDLPGADGEVPEGLIYPADVPASELVPSEGRAGEFGQAEDWPGGQAMSEFLAPADLGPNGVEFDGMALGGLAWDLGAWGNPFVPADVVAPEAITQGDPVIPMHLFT